MGMPVSMEVRVSNARSSQVQNAELVIYYPARADETGDYFYLLPDCVTGTAIMVCEFSLSLSLSLSPQSTHVH